VDSAPEAVGGVSNRASMRVSERTKIRLTLTLSDTASDFIEITEVVSRVANRQVWPLARALTPATARCAGGSGCSARSRNSCLLSQVGEDGVPDSRRIYPF
jgi:hypothetical protein